MNIDRLKVLRKKPLLADEVISHGNDRLTEADIAAAVQQQDPESIAQDDNERGVDLHAKNDLEHPSE